MTNPNIQMRAEIDLIGYNVGQETADLGNLAIRWRKVVWLNGAVVATEPHRVELTPLADVDETLAQCHAHIELMGYELTNKDDDIELVKLNVKRYMTPAVVKAAKARAAEQEAAMKAEQSEQ